MKLYRERVKAETLAVLDANRGNLLRTERETGIADSTIARWRDRESTHMDPETRRDAKRDLAQHVDEARWRYLDHLSDPAVVNKESGYYSTVAFHKLTEVHQLLTGGPTSRTELTLASFLASALPEGRTDSGTEALPDVSGEATAS